MKSESIEAVGKVIQILDEYRLIINIGKNYLCKGDRVYIYDQNTDVKDIDGTVLGSYECFKDSLQVVDVYDKFSICESIAETSSGLSFAISPLLEDTISKKTKLNIEHSLLEHIQTHNKCIKIGDIVKSCKSK